MSNQVSKILADQYIKLCSLKVDRQHEADLIGRLLENIQTYETDNPKFKPTEDRPSTSNDVSTQQIFSVKDDVLASALSTEIENFPRIQLALNICDYCFLVLSKNSHIPPLLINLIEQLKPTYMRLCLLSPLEVIRGCNPVLKIINTIISYTPQWKDESSVNFPTYGKLLSLINFKTKSSDNLYNAVDTGLAKILQIKENQQKRGLIFERRLIEREASITLTRTANSICKKIIQDLSMKYELDGLLSSFLKDTWSRLIILEYVRKDNSSFIEIVGTFILLALSVRKLRNNDELTFLANNMPALNESIIRGLQKLSIGESEINEFLSSIESIHLKLIKEQTDNPANLSNDKSQSKTSKQEDIIRLDPIDVFATTTEQIEPSVKPSDTNADKQLSKLETSVKSELESSESVEEINQKFQSCHPIDLLESSILTESVIDSNTNQWLIMDSEQIKLIYESIKSEYLKQDTELEENTKRLELEQNVAIDQWYMFNESSLSKLIYISADNGEYIFVDQSAQKSHQLTASNLLALLKSNAVVPFITPDLLTPSIKLALKDFKTYLDMRKKQKQTIVEAEHAEKSSIADKVNKDALTKDLKTNSNIKPIVAKNELPPLENNSTPISKVIPKNGMSVISIPTAIELSVGSWLRLKSLKQSTNCKLAARIVSKDSYIFVDRQGIKLIELSGSELNNQLQDGRMTLVSSESDNPILLESVIAKTRVLKSEN